MVSSDQNKDDGRMKRILVTGGAGFLGSHLCFRLLQVGHHVTCVDNLYTGNRWNLRKISEHPNFSFLKHDIVDPLNIEVEEIYNLACPASPIHYQRDPIATTKTCVIGAFNLLELAQDTGAKIFQASTSEIYGDPDVHPQPEYYHGRVNPCGIRSCYDEGKRCAESIFLDYHRKHGLRIKVGRIFNTYGPSMHPKDGRVVSNFIMQALSGEDLTVYGDGQQTRSFCYVDDLIEAILNFMQSSDEVIGPINLGNPEEFTVLQLAQRVIGMVGSGSQIIFQALPSDDPIRRRPDISLAKKLLGWSPRIGLEGGLLKTIEYFDGIKKEAFLYE